MHVLTQLQTILATYCVRAKSVRTCSPISFASGSSMFLQRTAN